jgi:SAM-dependent methyltransferase
MTDLARSNPLGRFTGLAEAYSKYRPGYPPEAIDFIIEKCALSAASLLVDVGCGTGISTRILAERGIKVLGIEPNAEMRATASAHPEAAGSKTPTYQDGRAESTGLPDGVADAVLAAQAFHWFDAPVSLAEFHRILKPSGWLILMWNERDERDEFTAAYGAIIRTSPDAIATELPRGTAGSAIFASPLFQGAEKVVFYHEQLVGEEGLIGRAFSASYAPRDPEQVTLWTNALSALFSKYERDGTVVLRYETSLYLAQRRA